MFRWFLRAAVVSGLALSVGVALAKPDGTSKMPSKRPPDYEVGKRLWTQSCWQCHGDAGAGDGPSAAALVGGVPTLKGKVTADTMDAMIDAVQQGKGRMPAYSEDIDAYDTRRILQYLRDVMDGKPPPAPEKTGGNEESSEG